MTKKGKQTAKNILCGIVSFLLLGGIIVGSIALAQNVDFRVNKPEENIEQTEDNTPAEDIIASEADNKASPLSIKLERIIPRAGAATPVGSDHMSYKLTATYDGESTTDKLDLSIAWANPSSSWANDKSVEDYLQLTHEDGAFEATVTALQAYGETIVLTGKIRNREISKSINLDYLAKPKTINDDNSTVLLDNTSGTFRIKMTDNDYDIGSVKPSKITGTVTFELESSIYNALIAKGWTDLQQTKSYTYDLLNPTDLNANIDQFMNRTLSSDELKDFNYDLYWVLFDAFDGENGCVFSATFEGNYYAMVSGVETACGQIDNYTCNNRFDVEFNSYEDLQTPLNDFDLGGDILFH